MADLPEGKHLHPGPLQQLGTGQGARLPENGDDFFVRHDFENIALRSAPGNRINHRPARHCKQGVAGGDHRDEHRVHRDNLGNILKYSLFSVVSSFSPYSLRFLMNPHSTGYCQKEKGRKRAKKYGRLENKADMR
jgi:hypothetical protein